MAKFQPIAAQPQISTVTSSPIEAPKQADYPDVKLAQPRATPTISSSMLKTGSLNTSQLSRYGVRNLPGSIHTQSGVNAMLGWNQSNMARNLSFFPRAAATAVTEMGSFAARIFDFQNHYRDLGFGEEAPDYTNWASEMFKSFEDYVNDEATPVHYREDYYDKSFGQQILTSEFWGSEASQGAGFALGNLLPALAISYFTGGAGAGILETSFARLGKLAQLSRVPASVIKATKRAATLSKSGALGAYNTARKGKALVTGAQFRAVRYIPKEFIRDAGIMGYTALQTHSESVAEASFLGIDLREQFLEKLKNEDINPATNKPWTREEADNQITYAMKNHYRYNLGVLFISNYFINNMLFGTAKLKSHRWIQAIGGDEASKATKMLRSALTFTQSSAEAALVEGFWEEGSQTSGEMKFKELAMSGLLEDDGVFRVWNKAKQTFASDYASMFGTTEGKKAIFLGGMIGTTMGITGTYKEIKKYNEFYDVLSQARNKSIAVTLGQLSKRSLYKMVTDPNTGNKVYELDAKGDPIWDPYFVFLDEQQKQGLIAQKLKIEEIKRLNPKEGERIEREYIIPQMLINYAMNEDMLQALQIELDNEMGDLSAIIDGHYTKQELMDLAKEIHGYIKETDTIEDMFRSMPSIRDELKDAKSSVTVEEFVSQYMRSGYATYGIELRKVNAVKSYIEGIPNRTAKEEDELQEAIKSADELKAMLSSILQASPKQWLKAYITHKKDSTQAEALIQSYAYNSTFESEVKRNTPKNASPKQTQAILNFLTKHQYVVAHTNQSKAFQSEFKMKNLSGREIIVTPQLSASNDSILLIDVATGQPTEYSYNPETKQIKSNVTGEVLKGTLRLHRKAITIVRDNAKNAVLEAVTRITEELQNAISTGHITEEDSQQALDFLKKVAKTNYRIDTKNTIELLDMLDGITKSSQAMFLVINSLKDLYNEISPNFVKELSSKVQGVEDAIVNLKNSSYLTFSEFVDTLKYAYESAKQNGSMDSSWDSYIPVLDKLNNESIKIENAYNFSQAKLLGRINDLFRVFTSAILINPTQANELNLELAEIVQHLQNDSFADYLQPYYATSDLDVQVREQAKPTINEPKKAFRPALSERDILTDLRLAIGTKNTNALRLLASQYALLDYFRNFKSTSQRLPSTLITIDHFINGAILGKYGADAFNVLSQAIYFYYMPKDGKAKNISFNEFNAIIDEDEQTEILNQIRGDVKMIFIDHDAKNGTRFVDTVGNKTGHASFNLISAADMSAAFQNSVDTPIIHTSLLSKDKMKGYQNHGHFESRYIIEDNSPSQLGILSMEAVNETEEAKAIREQALADFYAEMDALYDATITALDNGPIQMRYEKSTSGVFNDDLKMQYHESNAPSVMSIIRAFNEDFNDVVNNHRVFIARANTIRFKGVEFRVTPGRAYFAIQGRLVPLFAKKVSSTDASQIFEVLDTWLKDPTAMSFNRVRNYIHATAALASRNKAIVDTKGYYVAIDSLADGRISIIYNYNGSDANELLINTNEEGRKTLAENKDGILLAFSNMIYNLKAIETINDSSFGMEPYNKIEVDGGKLKLTRRTYEEYRLDVLTTKFNAYIKLPTESTGKRLTVNPSVQYSSPVQLPKAQVSKFTNQPAADELKSYLDANPERLQELYEDAATIMDQALEKADAENADEYAEIVYYSEFAKEYYEDTNKSSMITLSASKAPFEFLNFTFSYFNQMREILTSQYTLPEQLNEIKLLMFEYAKDLDSNNSDLGTTKC